MKLTIIGMGVAPGDLTLRGAECVRRAARVLVRSAKVASYASVAALGVPVRALDDVYERSRNFETLAGNLAREVTASARVADTVYLVEGDPSEDRSVRLIREKRPDAEIVPGVGKGQSCFAAAGVCGGQAVSAYDLAECGELSFPLAVYDVDSAWIASEVKLFLMKKAGEETECVFVRAGSPRTVRLYELDRQEEYDYSAAVVIPSAPFLEKERYTYGDLIRIVKMLRAPGGCPWDRAQTHESIRMNLIEEAYELAEAIDLRDDDKMLEETGDVLLQAVFHEVLAEERGAFDSDDAATAVCKKLIFRHSHIFGQDRAETSGQALDTWEKNKKIEKKQATASDAVRDVPKNFPALMRAEKVQKRAAKVGFDFDGALSALGKVAEEAEELKEALASGSAERTEEEGGDLIFAAVNAVRLAGAECEQALSRSTEKFIGRFCRMEQMIFADGKRTEDLSAAELDEYYHAAKNA